MAEGLDHLAHWCCDHFEGDVNNAWRKLCLLTHSATQTAQDKAPTQARLPKNDVLRAFQTIGIGIGFSSAKKEREGVFVRLCDGNHGSSVLGVADFRRVLAPRIKTILSQPRTQERCKLVCGRNSECDSPTKRRQSRDSAMSKCMSSSEAIIAEPEEESRVTTKAAPDDEYAAENACGIYWETKSPDASPGHVVRTCSFDAVGALDLDATMLKMMERVQSLTNQLRNHSFTPRPPVADSLSSRSAFESLKLDTPRVTLPSRCEAALEGTFSSLEQLEAAITERERVLTAAENEGRAFRQMEETMWRLEERVRQLEDENLRLVNEMKQESFDKGPVSMLTHNTLVDLLEGKGHLSGWREI